MIQCEVHRFTVVFFDLDVAMRIWYFLHKSSEGRSGEVSIQFVLVCNLGNRCIVLFFIFLVSLSIIFESFEEYDSAKTGCVASKTVSFPFFDRRINVWDIVSQPDASYLIKQVELNEGPLDQFSHDMEPFLRKQGMPVRLNRGILI